MVVSGLKRGVPAVRVGLSRVAHPERPRWAHTAYLGCLKLIAKKDAGERLVVVMSQT